MLCFCYNLQKVTIGALPRVETLHVIPLNASVDLDALGVIICTPFNLTIQQGDVISVPLGTNVTGDDIKRLLDRQSSVEVYIAVKSAKKLEVAFVLGPDNFGPAFPTEVPSLSLDSDHITISCTEAPDDHQLLFDASLSTTQFLAYPDGFNLSLDSERYSNNLPIGVTNDAMEEALDDLLAWQCAIPPFQENNVLLHYSYEEDGTGVRDDGGDIPRAYCGHYSGQSPGIVWESGVKLEPYSYVSEEIHFIQCMYQM